MLSLIKILDKGDKGESCEVQRVIATKINEDPLSQTEFRIVYNNLKQMGITWTQPKPWKQSAQIQNSKISGNPWLKSQ